MAEQSHAGKKPEQSPDNSILKSLGPAIPAAFAGFLTWVIAGHTESKTALTTLAAVVAGICGLVASLLYKRYLGILGSGAELAKSSERLTYIRLRRSLADGGYVARVYTARLTELLDGVDRFFGDAGMADRTLFPHVFGLKTPAPLWTAPAFDRCLLFALFYPFAILFIVWIVSGHVGVAEAALSLKSGLPGWRRGLAAAGFLITLSATWRGSQTSGRNSNIWFVVAALGAIVVPVAGAGPIVGAIAGAISGAGAIAGKGTLAGVVAAGAAIAGAAAGLIGDVVAGIVSVGIPVAVVVSLMYEEAIRREHQGLFVTLFSVLAIFCCFVSARELAPLPHWHSSGPMLFFFGVLPLLKAPYDWFFVGFGRALMRRGLELGGWWPFVLALCDALLAILNSGVMAAGIVIGIQAFDALAHGMAVMPLSELFSQLEANPTAPEYWWIYALPLATMIPSLLNLVVGGTSLMRGVPGAPSLLLKFLPANRAAPAVDRAWIAAVLTLQQVGGAITGILVQFALIYAVFWHVMPWLGLELLDMARALAAFDLPAKVLAGW